MYKIEDVTLFTELSQNQLKILKEQMIIRHYKKDAIVFYEGNKDQYLHILLDGVVRLYKTTPKGTQVHIHNFEAPEIVALFASFEDIAYPATCAFLTEGTIGLLPIHLFFDCLNNLEFSKAMVVSLAHRLKTLSDLLHKEIIYSAEAKIADLICTNTEIFKKLKNNEISYMLNITPETLSRILSKFKRENIISIDKHILTIHNKKLLENIIQH